MRSDAEIEALGAEQALARAVARQRAGELAAAEALYRRILAAWPHEARALNALGILLRLSARFEEALAAFEQAVHLRPDYADARHHRAMMLLAFGRWREGWAEYEQRPAVAGLAAKEPGFTRTYWDGGALAGRRILLWAEQGFGDMIQFCRYAPLVQGLGGRVVLDCHPELARLFRTLAGVDAVVARGEPAPAFERNAPLMSLPHLTGRGTPSEIPAEVPYLAAEPDLAREWAARIGVGRGLDVGLVWRGRPSHPDERLRTIALAAIAPLLELPGVRVHALQVEAEARAELGGLPPGLAVDDLGGAIGDFADTAAAMVNLDLVISVDTAAAHLAGALGLPVWVLLPAVPDWRWGLEGEATPWYPTMRLFRQRAAGDWQPVVAALRAALERRLENGTTRQEGNRSP